MGLEPMTSCVTGRHSNQAELTHLFWVSGCKGREKENYVQAKQAFFAKVLYRKKLAFIHKDQFSRMMVLIEKC